MEERRRRRNSGVSPPKRNESKETAGGLAATKEGGGDQTSTMVLPPIIDLIGVVVVLTGVKAKEEGDLNSFKGVALTGVKANNGATSSGREETSTVEEEFKSWPDFVGVEAKEVGEILPVEFSRGDARDSGTP